MTGVRRVLFRSPILRAIRIRDVYGPPRLMNCLEKLYVIPEGDAARPCNHYGLPYRLHKFPYKLLYNIQASITSFHSRQAVPQQAIEPFVSSHKLKYYTISRKISSSMTKISSRISVYLFVMAYCSMTGRDAKSPNP